MKTTTAVHVFLKFVLFLHIKPTVSILPGLVPLQAELPSLKKFTELDLSGLGLPSPLTKLELEHLTHNIEIVNHANSVDDGAEYKVYPDDIKSDADFAKERLGLKQHVEREEEDNTDESLEESEDEEEDESDSEEVSRKESDSDSDEDKRVKRFVKKSKKKKKKKKKIGKSGPNKGVDLTQDPCFPGIFDQKTCASCYVWAMKLAAEYELCKAYDKKVQLSVQEVVDCSNIRNSPKFGNFGCSGGHMTDVAHYYQTSAGWTSYDSYPYESREMDCKVEKNDPNLEYVLSPSEYNITYVGWPKSPYTEKDIVTLIDNHKPVIVSIYSNEYFRHYKKGILGLKKDEPCKCPKTVNHAVVIFGYGYEPETGLLYFKGVNTWSKLWGEEGCFRFASNKNCLCVNWEPGTAKVEKVKH